MPNFKLQELGLEAYLNSTKGLHNGKGFKDFERMLNKGTGPSTMAQKFGVTRPTIYEWRNLYNELQKVKETKT